MTLQEWAHNLPAIRDEAKALWPLTPGVNYELYKPAWQIHLEKMLLSDNPTQYLKANTPEKD